MTKESREMVLRCMDTLYAHCMTTQGDYMIDTDDKEWDGDVCSCGYVKTSNGDLCVDLLAPVPTTGTCRC